MTMMIKPKYSTREIPTVSLSNFTSRVDKITSELVNAAENVGFFCIVDHGISKDDVDAIFSESARFFSLPEEGKSQVRFSSAHNAGWEKNFEALEIKKALEGGEMGNGTESGDGAVDVDVAS